MLIPEVRSWRTDDVSVVHWSMDSDGSDVQTFLMENLPGDWTVSLTPYRTINASNPNGEEGLNVDRGDYLVMTSDNKIIRTTEDTLRLLFN